MPPAADAVVIFDLDGVLVDSRRALSGSIAHALRVHGHGERHPAELTRLIGPPIHLAFAELLGESPESDAVEACVTTFRERYWAIHLTETAVFAGIPEALGALAAEHRLAVATSKPRVAAESLLDGLGLRGFFSVVAGPELSAVAESKTTTVAAALDALGASRGAMIGDRSFDMIAARAHGLLAVGVTWGIGTEGELTGAGAQLLAGDPAQLETLLIPFPAHVT